VDRAELAQGLFGGFASQSLGALAMRGGELLPDGEQVDREERWRPAAGRPDRLRGRRPGTPERGRVTQERDPLNLDMERQDWLRQIDYKPRWSREQRPDPLDRNR
jgi:hypothetical protein